MAGIDLRSSTSQSGASVATPDLLGFDMAVADRANNPVDILVLGDSVAQGNGVNGDVANRWINKMLTALRQHYPVQNVAGGFGYLAAWGFAAAGAGGMPAETGTVTHSVNGLGHRSSLLGAGATLTFSRLCTSFQIMCRRSTNDAFTVSVDGGAATTVTAGPTGEFVYSSAALSRTTHSIVITQTANAPEIEGVMFFDGDETKAIRLWDSAKGGAKAGDFSTASGGSLAWRAAASGAGLTPDLVVISFGLNDALAVNAATFSTDVANLIAACRAQWANVPVLLIHNYQPPSRQTGLVDPWSAYGAALKALADADAATAFLDLTYRIGSIPTDVYGFLADTTHPSNNGHQFIAQVVADAVRPGIRDTDTLKTANINAEALFLDTPTSPTPTLPTARGALLYADSNASVIGLGGFGDVLNQLARTVALSANATVRAAWRYLRITTGASTITITLTSAGSSMSQRHTIKKVDSGAGTVVVTRGGSDTIEGATTKTLSGQWSSITVVGGASGTWEIESTTGTVT